MNNIFAFIPARAGSKSIPGKNIKLLGEKPLIAWSIETAFEAGLQRVIVSTDGEDIAKVAREYGAEVIMRPPELAQDDTSMFRVVQSEVPKIEPIPEYVMLLQPTSPLRKKVHIKTAISSLVVNADKFDSLISVERVPEKWNPAQVVVSTASGPRMANGAQVSQRITRRQAFPEAWVPTGEIYLFKTENFEKGGLYGENVMLLEVEPGININSQEDWDDAELQLKKVKVKEAVEYVNEDPAMKNICDACQ